MRRSTALWFVVFSLCQALQSHSGKEHELIDRFIEKYGQVAWNWFVGDGDEEEVPLPELTHEACGEEGHSDAKSMESWRLLHDTLLAGRVFIGLHADQATDYIAFFGFLYGKPWVSSSLPAGFGSAFDLAQAHLCMCPRLWFLVVCILAYSQRAPSSVGPLTQQCWSRFTQ